mmetsp:Transcript_22223/g.46883  ORF Transcript_22223/g.46883 Transcript_22223/m.46883 type:complete len:213 (+) Transcript_22223:1123-1761(+)
MHTSLFAAFSFSIIIVRAHVGIASVDINANAGFARGIPRAKQRANALKEINPRSFLMGSSIIVIVRGERRGTPSHGIGIEFHIGGPICSAEDFGQRGEHPGHVTIRGIATAAATSARIKAMTRPIGARSRPIKPRAPILLARCREGRSGQLFRVQAVGDEAGVVPTDGKRVGMRLRFEMIAESVMIFQFFFFIAAAAAAAAALGVDGGAAVC